MKVADYRRTKSRTADRWAAIDSLGSGLANPRGLSRPCHSTPVRSTVDLAMK
jgi:hypothetical protein